jgi:hypothetical protein
MVLVVSKVASSIGMEEYGRSDYGVRKGWLCSIKYAELLLTTNYSKRYR